MRASSRALTWIAVVWMWLGAAPVAFADADPASVHLEWPRPIGSTCVPENVLEQDVEQALGRRVFTTRQAARMQIRATIEDGPLGVSVRLEARNVKGELLGTRELHALAGQCAELRSGIGLVLTLLIEAVAAEEAPVQLDIGVWAGSTIHVLPRAAFGVGPSLALRFDDTLQLRVDAAYWLPVAIETARGIEADLHALSGAVRICPRVAGSGHSGLSLQLCGGAQLGALITMQTAPTRPGPQSRFLAQALLELRGAWHTGGSSRLELAVGPVLALTRTRIYTVRGDGERTLVYRVPSLGVILSVGFII